MGLAAGCALTSARGRVLPRSADKHSLPALQSPFQMPQVHVALPNACLPGHCDQSVSRTTATHTCLPLEGGAATLNDELPVISVISAKVALGWCIFKMMRKSALWSPHLWHPSKEKVAGF